MVKFHHQIFPNIRTNLVPVATYTKSQLVHNIYNLVSTLCHNAALSENKMIVLSLLCSNIHGRLMLNMVHKLNLSIDFSPQIALNLALQLVLLQYSLIPILSFAMSIMSDNWMYFCQSDYKDTSIFT